MCNKKPRLVPGFLRCGGSSLGLAKNRFQLHFYTGCWVVQDAAVKCHNGLIGQVQVDGADARQQGGLSIEPSSRLLLSKRVIFL